MGSPATCLSMDNYQAFDAPPARTRTPAKRRRLLWRLALCFVGSAALLALIGGLVLGLAHESLYFRCGPRAGLSILGVPIDTWPRYAGLHAALLATQAVDTLVNEFSGPILGFNIYNPDKGVITDFTHFELQFFAQSIWLFNGLRGVLMLLVTISQFDVAVAKVVYSELFGMVAIYWLLREKTFVLAEDVAPGA